MEKKEELKKENFWTKGRKIVLGFTLFWALYLILPFLAPVFLAIGWTGPANLIYQVYSFLCHQRSERSLFLFGDKPAYEKEEFSKINIDSLLSSRHFHGNEIFGYKVAFCFRDVGLYFGLFLTALVFFIKPDLIKRPIKLPVIAIGVLPMILDGSLQLVAELLATAGVSLFGLTDPNVPFYVSNNLKRLITGLLFGGTVGFWLYPSIINQFADEEK